MALPELPTVRAMPASGWMGALTLVLTLLGLSPSVYAFIDVTAGEEDEQISFPVRRIGPSDGAASVRYATCPTVVEDQAVLDACGILEGTATAGDDYTAVSGKIEFSDGETSATVLVALVNDRIDEGDETLYLVLFEPERVEIPAGEAVTLGTIEDDDPSPVLSADNPAAAEDAGSLAFAVTLDRPSARDLNVPWNTSDRTAIAGEDYVKASGKLDFIAGEVAKTITVTVTEDDVAEASEQFAISFKSIDHLSIGDGGIGTIEDNDQPTGPPEVVVKVDPVKESKGPAKFAVSLTRPADETVTVTYQTVDGTAKANGGGVAELDYGATGRQSLTFAPGETMKTVDVAVTDDDVWEGNETFDLQVVSATGATAGDGATATITDDESKPLPRAGPSLRVPESIGTATLSASLSLKSAHPTVMSSRIDAIDTTPGDDHQATIGPVTIPAGNLFADIEFNIVDDTLAEGDERVAVFFTASPGRQPTTIDNRQMITIVDDDVVTISIFDQSGTEGEEFVFDVALSQATVQTVTVNWTTAPDTATAPADYKGDSGTVTFAPMETRKTLLVQTNEDKLHECSETFTVSLDNPQGAELAKATAQGTINDNDEPPQCFIVDVSGEGGDLCAGCEPSAGSGLEASGGIDFSVGLSATSDCGVEVRYRTADFTAVAGSDYRSAARDLTIPAGETKTTVTVGLIDDDIAEQTEQFQFVLPDCASQTQPTSVYAAIIDDDQASAIVSIRDVEGKENSGALTFDVKLSVALSLPASVSYETSDSSALAAEDYSAVNGRLTFDPGTTVLTVDVPLIDDSVLEQTREEFSLTLSNPVNARFVRGERTVAEGTIIDDEMPPSLSAVAASGIEGSTLTFPVHLSHSSPVAVTVEYLLQGGTARVGRDYEQAGGRLAFEPGVTEQSVEVVLVDDNLNEPEENFTLVIRTPVNATIAAGRATGTIEDDDALPEVQIPAASSVAENHSYRHTLALTRGSNRSEYPISVRAYAAPGTARTDDYEALDEQLTIAAKASTASPELSLRTAHDLLDEDDEHFTINYEVVDGQAVLSRATTRVTIVDDDEIPRVGLGDGDADEGAALSFAVHLEEKSGRRVSMGYAVRHETTSAADFRGAVEGTLVFQPGDLKKTITLHPVADRLNEPDEETFTLELFDLKNVLTGSPEPFIEWMRQYSWEGEASGVVRDQDAKPGLTISDEEATEGDSNQDMRFSLDLTTGHFQEVLIDYEVRDVTTAQDEDYTGSYAGRLTFPSGETSAEVALSVIDDALSEATETFEVAIFHPRFVVVAGEGPIDILKSIGTGTIFDDDVLVSVNDVAGTEGETVAFTVSIPRPALGTVEVDYELSGATATPTTDFEPRSGQMSGTLSFAVGESAKQVSVELRTDDVHEDDETFLLTLTGVRGGKIAVDVGTATIEDATLPPEVHIASDRTGTEGTVLYFDVELVGLSTKTVSVNYATADVTALAGEDYRGKNGILSFAPGENAKQLRVRLLSDDIDEPEETFTLTLSDPIDARLHSTRAAAVGTIEDTDEPPVVTVADAHAEEGGSLAFEISLLGRSTQEVAVAYSTGDDTAVAGEDYEAQASTLTIDPETSGGTVEVAVLDDAVYEGDETLKLILESATNATTGRSEAVGTIGDEDDKPVVATMDVTGVEGTELVFEVSLEGASSRPVTLEFATSDGTADADDYEGQTGTLTFTEGTGMQQVTVALTDDLVDEPTEHFHLALNNPENAVIDTTEVTGEIEDNDEPPEISIADAADADENGVLMFPVTVAGLSSEAVTVQYIVEDGSATAGEDYLPDEGVLTFAPGESAGMVEVELIDDGVHESDEDLRIVLGEAAGGNVVDAEGLGTIIDNDDPPGLSVTGGAGIEGEVVEFSVRLAGDTHLPATVSYATSDGTAVASDDYEEVTGTLTFEPGESIRTVSVPLVEDDREEPSENFAIVLSSATNATIDIATADGTILDDDGTPQLSIADAAGGEGSVLDFVVTLAGLSEQQSTVSYATSDGTATAVEDYGAVTGTLTFEPGESSRTVSVVLVDDAVHEPEETFAVTLSAAENADVAAGSAVGRIADDDDLPTLSVASVTGREGTVVNFLVTLTGAGSQPARVSYATRDKTAVAGVDYVAVSGALTFASGSESKAVPVRLLYDGVDEADETFVLQLRSPTSAALGVHGANGTIEDIDELPALSVTGGEGVEGGTVEFAVTLAGSTNRSVRVTYATSDGSALSGSDYRPVRGTLALDPGETSRTVSIRLLDDAEIEPDENFSLELSSPANARLEVNAVTGTIVDDDRADKAPTKGRALLFETTTRAGRQGFMRVINHSDVAGEVHLEGIDDSGIRVGPLTLPIGAGMAKHFNSDDFERGNADKGFPVGVGPPSTGSWRLELSSELDIEALSYARTPDGFVTSLHDSAPATAGVHRVVFLNPGGNFDQLSQLRLVNPGTTDALVTITGTDDMGGSSAKVVVELPAGTAREWTAAELESGTGTHGALGDGEGKWRLRISSDRPVVAMSLIESPTGNLTNLSTLPNTPGRTPDSQAVPLFPSASDPTSRQGFVRVVNRSEAASEVRIEAFDKTDWEYDPLTLLVGAGEVVSFNSDDLELGNTGKGLTGSTGAGEGDWWLELSSDGEIEVWAYIRTRDGFLTSMHDLAPTAEGAWRVVFFNPGENVNQVSVMWLVNPGDADAAVTITGVDDNALTPGTAVRVTVSAGSSRRLTSAELESGDSEAIESGAIGDGQGKWRLRVESDRPIRVMSLLENPTGHLTNLSTAPGRRIDSNRAVELHPADPSQPPAGSAWTPTADE